MEADGAGEQMRPLLTRVTSRVRAPRAAGLLGGSGGARNQADKGGGAAGFAVQPLRPGPGAPPPPRSRRASPSPLCGRPGRGCEGAAAPRRPEWGQPAARRGHPRHPHPRRGSGETPAPPRGHPSALDPDHLFFSPLTARLPYSRVCSPAGVLVPVVLALEFRLAPRKPIFFLLLSAAPPVSSLRQW